MNTKELAEVLDHIEYSEVMRFRASNVAATAKQHRLVVAYGYSDDLLEFDGAIYDEGYAPGVVLIDDKGVLPSWESASEDEQSAAEYFQRKAKAKAINAVWNNYPKEGEPAWTLKTEIPHATFSIIEDGQPFSRGIVFSINDL